MSPSPHLAALLLTVVALTQCGGEPAPAASEARPPLPAAKTAQPASPPPETLPPRRQTMTATERRAIKEAQSRRAAPAPKRAPQDNERPTEDVMGSTVIGAAKDTPDEPGLTQFERRAAMDDPAVNMPLKGATEGVESEQAAAVPAIEAKRTVNSPRPGVELRGAVDGLKLVDLAIATEVKRREPTGIDSRFATLPRRFHCFCVFENRQQTTQVTHVWKRDGRVVSRVELEVGKSPKWRTWSRQRLQPSWTGNWTCEVQSASGRILGIASARAGD
ncbi:MAG: DUF2914 domain-containing protein [Myxococcota bacterium]